ncbi:MAG: hypothetical protein GXY45_07455, partial [Ramlibacter sp.]|nr:hypothetical protein [Ramlibacter sp.]
RSRRQESFDIEDHALRFYETRQLQIPEPVMSDSQQNGIMGLFDQGISRFWRM